MPISVRRSVTPPQGHSGEEEQLESANVLVVKDTVILIVEDEVLIRMEAVQMLEDAGYITVEASNADDAIRILESRMDIRAVFTDINMSGSMDGLKLAHAIRGRWPPIHLIVTSGLQYITEDQLPAKGRFVRKPYQGAQIISIFRELLAAA